SSMAKLSPAMTMALPRSQGLGLPFRTLARLAQDEESGLLGGEAGSGEGLGAVSCWDSAKGTGSKGLGRRWRQREDCAIIVQRHRSALTAKEVFYEAPHSCIAGARDIHSSVVRPGHHPSHGSIWLYDRYRRQSHRKHLH